MSLNFIKMHGLGNDFLIVDCRTGAPILTSEQIRTLSNRKRGVGFDQIVHLLPTKSGNADVYLDMYNADGSPLGACGNATRCVADILMKEKRSTTSTIQTIVGILECTHTENGQICVDMGLPRLEWHEIPVLRQCDTLNLPLEGDPVGVSMGNPHCVYFCEDIRDVYVDKLGPKVEHDPFFPERTNVEYVSMSGKDHLRMRVWERGTGITEACGTGACAAAVAAVRRGLTGRRVRVTLDGGDLLIEWRQSDGHVLMTGPVAYVFEGTISL